MEKQIFFPTHLMTGNDSTDSFPDFRQNLNQDALQRSMQKPTRFNLGCNGIISTKDEVNYCFLSAGLAFVGFQRRLLLADKKLKKMKTRRKKNKPTNRHQP